MSKSICVLPSSFGLTLFTLRGGDKPHGPTTIDVRRHRCWLTNHLPRRIRGLPRHPGHQRRGWYMGLLQGINDRGLPHHECSPVRMVYRGFKRVENGKPTQTVDNIFFQINLESTNTPQINKYNVTGFV